MSNIIFPGMSDGSYWPEDKKIECNYIHCIAGLGLSGRGKCFNFGDPGDENCDKFESQAEYEEEIDDKIYCKSCEKELSESDIALTDENNDDFCYQCIELKELYANDREREEREVR
jgi:hypothetical protein